MASYERNVRELIEAALNHGLFNRVTNKVKIGDLNTAKSLASEKDEDFAARLQEAEIREAGLVV